MTAREWQDLLYSLGLFGHDWLYVDRVAEAYLSWKLTGETTRRFGTQGWGPVTEEKLVELLSRANLSKLDQRLIASVLHHRASPGEFPMPRLPRSN
jgi:hypothetical protein